MTEQIVIKEQTDERLKAIAYDLIVQINQLQSALNQVQLELKEREEKAVNVPKPESND
jgi:hypothetical protein